MTDNLFDAVKEYWTGRHFTLLGFVPGKHFMVCQKCYTPFMGHLSATTCLPCAAKDAQAHYKRERPFDESPAPHSDFD